MKELFIEDLKKVKGGFPPGRPCQCCGYTTMACCEEANCSSCCPPTS